MEKKVAIILVVFFTALVLISVFVFLDFGGGEELGLDDPAMGNETATVLNHVDDHAAEPDGNIREPLVANADPLPVQGEAMPLSFRKSLGGFKGRIVEEDLTPVSQISVEIFGAGMIDALLNPESFMETDSFPYKLKSRKTTTAKDGVFLLQGVFPRAFYALSVDGLGPRALARVIDHLPSPGELVDLGDIVLPRFAVLKGRVVNEEGVPLPGARVRATNLPPIVYLSGIQDYRKGCSVLVDIDRSNESTVYELPPVFHELFSRLPFPKTTSGPDGSFCLEGVPLGTVTLLADLPGFVASTRGPLSTGKGGEIDLGDVEVKPGSTVHGKVVDHENNPVEGAEVRIGTVHSFDEALVLQPPKITDEAGAFAQSGIANFSAMAVARRFPKDPWTVVGPFNPAKGLLTITLPPSYSMLVKTVDAAGEPVDPVKLKIRVPHRWQTPFFMNMPKRPATSMERPEPGVILLNALPPGKYELLLFAPGYATTALQVQVHDAPSSARIVMKPACTAHVRVVSQTTKEPVEWAEVYTWEDDEDFLFNPVKVRRGRTNADGRVVLKRLGEGAFNVSVSHPGYAVGFGEIEVPSEVENVIELDPGGTLEGVVRQGDSNHEPPYLLVAETRSSMGDTEDETPRLTTTDLDGRFKLTHLDPGNWKISVMQRLFDKDTLGLVEWADHGRSLQRYRAHVKSGETTQVEIMIGSEDQGPSSTVSGSVTVDGVPVQNAKVTYYAHYYRKTRTDAHGHYCLEQVAVSNSWLYVDIPSDLFGVEIGLCREIRVEENVPLYEGFDLITGSLTGTIVDKNSGDPVREALKLQASMEGEDNPYRVGVTTRSSEDGTFLFDKLPIGVYTLRSKERPARCVSLNGIKVFPGMEAGPVTLERLTPIIVSGRLDFPPSWREMPWLVLYFQDKVEYASFGVRVDIDNETGEFSTNELRPGSYKVLIYSSGQELAEPISVEITEFGDTNLYLPFEWITGE